MHLDARHHAPAAEHDGRPVLAHLRRVDADDQRAALVHVARVHGLHDQIDRDVRVFGLRDERLGGDGRVLLGEHPRLVLAERGNLGRAPRHLLQRQAIGAHVNLVLLRHLEVGGDAAGVLSLPVPRHENCLVVGVAVLGGLPLVVECVAHAVGGALLDDLRAGQIGDRLPEAGGVDVSERPETVLRGVHQLEGARSPGVLCAGGGYLVAAVQLAEVEHLPVCGPNARRQRVVLVIALDHPEQVVRGRCLVGDDQRLRAAARAGVAIEPPRHIGRDALLPPLQDQRPHPAGALDLILQPAMQVHLRDVHRERHRLSAGLRHDPQTLLRVEGEIVEQPLKPSQLDVDDFRGHPLQASALTAPRQCLSCFDFISTSPILESASRPCGCLPAQTRAGSPRRRRPGFARRRRE